MLATGLDGIDHNRPLPDAVEEDLYKFDEAQLASLNIDVLPSSLYEAIQEMKENALIREVLGEHLFRRYVRVKTREWSEFKMQVTPWEVEKYLDI
jgi:glutamine synthetase